MALVYITSIEVEPATMIVPILAQMTGAYISPRFVVKMPVKPIRILLTLGMTVAMLRLAAEASGFPDDAREVVSGADVAFPKSSPCMGGANKAELAAQRLNLLNHFRWHFACGHPGDTAYLYDSPPKWKFWTCLSGFAQTWPVLRQPGGAVTGMRYGGFCLACMRFSPPP